jgi:hypothetical protein
LFFILIYFFKLKFRWQTRQNEIQLLANRNATAAQQQYEANEIEFRQEYEYLKQSASRERTRINELHETHLDIALNTAKTEANKKLINAWNEKPLKVNIRLTRVLLHHSNNRLSVRMRVDCICLMYI